MRKNKTLTKALVVYYTIFFVIWTIAELYLWSFLEAKIFNPYILQFIKSGVIKTIIWTLPAIILWKRFSQFMYVPYKEMFQIKGSWVRFISIFLLLSAYVLISAYVTEGKIVISNEFSGTAIIIVFFVGITEEMVFRGWLLNSTFSEKNRWSAILINAFLFLAIHFPRWFTEGNFIAYITSGSFLIVMVLSAIFSWTFIKSKNIIIPIVLHMSYDLLAMMLE